MRRRDFISLLGGAAAAWPLAARAQQPDRIRRVVVLASLAEDHPEMKLRVAAFREGLERLGWSEGRNVRIDYRFASAPNQSGRCRWQRSCSACGSRDFSRERKRVGASAPSPRCLDWSARSPLRAGSMIQP